MSTSATSDPIGSFNEVLNEMMDLVQELKEAHRKVPENRSLHVELDLLFEDARTWARMFIVEDEVLGVSPLDSMPSVAGRRPIKTWPGVASDDEVRQVVGEQLERLVSHVDDAVSQQQDEGALELLREVQTGLLDHVKALTES